jgi:ribosomal protein L23
MPLPTDIPLTERNAWEEWMARDRAEILRLEVEIKAKAAEIDTIVYELFDLTPEEIDLLEVAIA